ncbi:hypothetical protein MAUB1S_05309 [Mycolicibacterium aubagnense]
MARPARSRARKSARDAGPASPVSATDDKAVPEISAPRPDSDDAIPNTAAPEPEYGQEPASDRSYARRWLLGGVVSVAAHVGAGFYLAAIIVPPAADPGIVDSVSVEWVPPDVSEVAPKAERPADAVDEPARAVPLPDIEKAPEKLPQDEPAQADPLPEDDKPPTTVPARQPRQETAEPRTEAPQPKQEAAPAPQVLRSVQENVPAVSAVTKAAEIKPARPVEKPGATRQETRKAESHSRSRKSERAEPAKPVRQQRKSAPKGTVVADGSGSSEKAVRPAAVSPKQATSTGPAKAAGRGAASPVQWQAEVIAHIRRFRQYPPGASGSASVRVQLRINAQGVVRSASVAGSSGNAALDRAAIETVKRASPVPAPPPEIARSSMTLAITISFKR